MAKTKLDVFAINGKIYYTDTNSLVTDQPLPQEMVGQGLGQFKYVKLVLRGYFIQIKTYLLALRFGKLEIKAKGLLYLKIWWIMINRTCNKVIY